MQLTLKNYYSEIDGLSFNIKNPGDWFSLRFFIVNGTIDASVSDVINDTLEIGSDISCLDEECLQIEFGGEAKEEDIELYNNYFIYKITYTDTNQEVKIGDELKAKTEKNITLTLGYDINANDMPKVDYSTGDSY